MVILSVISKLMRDTNYINLSLKYRPQVIDDLLGQQHIVTILTNAFKSGRIYTAFLLTGIRGVGKTTTARIIAKALNCLNDEYSTSFRSCGICDNCMSITNGNSIDVLEIDAASRTGVDDIRVIIEQAKYTPLSSNYKIFIIDEVHMLSKNAFNALLKTLEEPPLNVKFIFATTEIRKIPLTILSRCQKLNLRRLTLTELTEHLSTICTKEDVVYDQESLQLIAKYAQGSVRDSLSLLDQAILYSDNNLKLNTIKQMFGVDLLAIYQLFNAIIKKDLRHGLQIITQLLAYGTEYEMILADLLHVVHVLSVKCYVQDMHGLELAEEEIQLIDSLADNIQFAELLKYWQIIMQGIKELKDYGSLESIFYMTINKLIYAHDIIDINTLIKKFNHDTYDNNRQPKHLNAQEDQLTDKHNSSIAVGDATTNLEANQSENSVASIKGGDINIIASEDTIVLKNDIRVDDNNDSWSTPPWQENKEVVINDANDVISYLQNNFPTVNYLGKRSNIEESQDE